MSWNPTPATRAIHMAWVRHAIGAQRLGLKPMTFRKFVMISSQLKFKGGLNAAV